MEKLKFALFFLCCSTIFAHNINPSNQVLRHWFIQKENKFIDGSFSMFKNGKVYIENNKNEIVGYSLNSLSIADQAYASHREIDIMTLNSGIMQPKKIVENKNGFYIKISCLCLLILIFTCLLYHNNKLKYFAPLIYIGVIFLFYSFTKKALSTTDPVYVTSAFAQFSSTVSTNYNSNFFYVNSNGIPQHTMMVGISGGGWQQQVPMSKCYVNPNYWQIPLNPVAASIPVPVTAAHFTKGAIAIAVNGVPIFNPYTNTGANALTTGQLDNFGGHCGRGDDYHYHIAPLHLITLNQASATLPIAYALDGYAVYGGLEPTGVTMTTLDANHGHIFNGVYHYHGTTTIPYMIGSMVGVVTEDANSQIIPQPQGTPVRTENWTPLNGAVITSCVANASFGYNTAYTLNGTAGYATNYTATVAGLYTFQYVTPTGTTSTNYTSSAQCLVPNLGDINFVVMEQKINIYPNPVTNILNIDLGNKALESEVQNISIFDLNGRMLSKYSKFEPVLDVKNISKGSYIVKIQFLNSIVSRKILIK